MRRFIRLALVLLILTSLGGALSAAHAAPSTLSAKPFVKAGKTGLGAILVNRKGLTLYYWEQEKPGRIACTGGCAQAWPPLFVSRGATVQHAVRGIKGTFGTIQRPEGSRQVTFNGRALYLYIGDKKPGDTNCQAQEGWYVIKTTGRLTGPSGTASHR